MIVKQYCAFWMATAANGNTVYIATAIPFKDDDLGLEIAEWLAYDLFTKEQFKCPDEPGFYMLSGLFMVNTHDEGFEVSIDDPIWTKATMQV